VTSGESLIITVAAAATQDFQHRHEEQEPLRVMNPTPVATIRDGIEKANQILRNTLFGYGGVCFGQPLRARLRLRER